MLTYDEMIKGLNILLVDDDEDYIAITDMYLKSKGYNVTIVKNGKDAIEEAKTGKYHILLVDYFMPEMTGEEVINEIRKFNKRIIIILQTGFSGQKPHIQMIKELNIQNYHDKTDGPDSLDLKIMSGIKSFNQQNEISAIKYKENSIAKIISSVATSLKTNLMNISATMEITNLLVLNNESNLTAEQIETLKNTFISNKESLEKVNNILTTLIKGYSKEANHIYTDNEIVETLDLILTNELKEKEYLFTAKASLRNKSYVTGEVAELIFVIAEVVLRLADIESENKKIDFVLTEDESNWYFKIYSSNAQNLDLNRVNIFESIAMLLPNVDMKIEDKEIYFSLKK